MSKAIVQTLLLAVMSGMLVFAASAQQKYGVKKTFTIKRGETSTRVVSSMPSSLEVHEYYFRARAGQRMTVNLVSNDKNISFYIMSQPDGYCITPDIAVRSFNDTLPDTGTYKLIVNTNTRQGAKYALEIDIASER